MALPLAAAIWAALATVIVPLAVRLLVGIGVASVTYLGVGELWDTAQAAVATNLNATSESILIILGMARVDDAIQIVLSAGGAVLFFKGLNAATGAITRAKWTPKLPGG